VQAGHEVTVVTGVPNVPSGVVYPGYRNQFRPQREQMDGIHVVRVWTYVAPNAGFAKRIANYLSYMLTAVLAGLFVKRPHVVVATSPQFFCGWAGVLLTKLRRLPFVLEIRDIWPESIAAVGAMKKGWLTRLLEFLERTMYRSADRIVAVGEGYRDNILSKVKVGERITVITNGVDLEKFQPAQPDGRFRQQWKLDAKFVCSYIGTIGMAHGLEVVLDAAEILRRAGRDDVAFCLVGDGAERARLQAAAAARGLSELVVFTGRQPRGEVPSILASSDACLIHLRGSELFETVIPSKIFETMAMQRPILMGVRGPARDIVLAAKAGIAIEPDSAPSLVQALTRLADDRGLAQDLGRHARDYVAEHFDRDRLAIEYLRLLHEVAGLPTHFVNGTDPVSACDSTRTAVR